jgi:hypothetical protein
MRRHPQVRRTYDREQDTFRHAILAAAAFLLALIFNDRFTIREVKILSDLHRIGWLLHYLIDWLIDGVTRCIICSLTLHK